MPDETVRFWLLLYSTDVISLSDTTNLGISLDPVVLHSVSCNGNEGSLLDCTFDTDTRADTHTTDVGVECIVRARPGECCTAI